LVHPGQETARGSARYVKIVIGSLAVKKQNKSLAAVIGAALVVGMAPVAVQAEGHSDAYSIVRGGRLYDKWFKVAEEAKRPDGAQPAYPEDGKYRGDEKGADWRCKECHGWDYKGVSGVYGKGKHYTGIKGIDGMIGADPKSVVAVLSNDTHALQGTGLTDADLYDLAMFVTQGQVEMGNYIDPETKQSNGNVELGRAYFDTVCANCHGLDGRYDDHMEPLGELSNDNPWEVLHKILNGQPKEEMPALHPFGPEAANDILAYIQTLPKEPLKK